jgi:leucyl/phenylalanyl-tRNA---protein transferase
MEEPLSWVTPAQALPHPKTALTEPNGLVCAGVDLSAARLFEAYSKGMFPWFSEGQPVLWWSPNPRMVLKLENFRLHRSLEKSMRKNLNAGVDGAGWQIRIDTHFEAVMRACAEPRMIDGKREAGTWITEDIVAAYCDLNQQGKAHSVEVWRVEGLQEQLVGGLYGVALGKMFYGESMFARETNASKAALAWLVKYLKSQSFVMIDCQQATDHLSFMGAEPIDRHDFLAQIDRLTRLENTQFPNGIQA